MCILKFQFPRTAQYIFQLFIYFVLIVLYTLYGWPNEEYTTDTVYLPFLTGTMPSVASRWSTGIR